MSLPRVGPALLAALLFAVAVFYVVPRALEAHATLALADDPALIAQRALDEKFTTAVAEREIRQALDKRDADLANSFVALAASRHVVLDATLIGQVKAALAEEQSTIRTAKNFARGFVVGEPNDMASLAGTTAGDLFVFGDIRDALREGTRLARGDKADTLVLGLACIGLAITAGTYATLGFEAPARIGLSLAKAARKTGALSADLAASFGRLVRTTVDWSALKKAIAGASISEPALALRAARGAFKVQRADGLVHFARDIGRVEAKADAPAALDALHIAQSPKDMSRLAELAAKEGGKTRAILKVAGRAAIVLTGAAFDLGLWIFGALLTLFGFISSLKAAAERITLRLLRRRKQHRRRAMFNRALAAISA